ncbi:hypothetical protein PSCICF_27600 [Pseudomonas cichorii]|nr:hypothetical protein PSCICF_27600 [Pseudomonas cichorii]
MASAPCSQSAAMLATNRIPRAAPLLARNFSRVSMAWGAGHSERKRAARVMLDGEGMFRATVNN